MLHVFVRIILIYVFAATLPAHADDTTYNIYIDADFSNNTASAEAISLGVETALAMHDFSIQGLKCKVIRVDHHGSTPRSRYNLEKISQDPNALAVFGGMHSPPLISNRDFINEKQILTLVPWAAATPITRTTLKENWIFRLSLDDSKVGAFLVNKLIKRGKQKPYLLLEDTGWGRANFVTMSKALEKNGLGIAGSTYFHWNLTDNKARYIIQQVRNTGADSLLLVANTPEGVKLAKAIVDIYEEPKRLGIYSHWGITGGNFVRSLGLSTLEKLDLRFIQTQSSFFKQPPNELTARAMDKAAELSQNLGLSTHSLEAPVGFVHAFDLTNVFIAAAEQSELRGQASIDSKKVKHALENLKTPVDGFVKLYRQPFSIYSRSNRDAHEALNEEDFIMARFDATGHIELLWEALTHEP